MLHAFLSFITVIVYIYILCYYFIYFSFNFKVRDHASCHQRRKSSLPGDRIELSKFSSSLSLESHYIEQVAPAVQLVIYAGSRTGSNPSPYSPETGNAEQAGSDGNAANLC
jgi:hypothetical protein